MCRAMPRYAVLCRAVAWRAVLCCAVACGAMLCCALLRCAVLRCVVLRCVVLCCAVPCCAVPCCVVLCRGSLVPPGAAWGGGGEGQTGGFAVCGGSVRARDIMLVGGWWAWFGVVWFAGSVLRGAWVGRPAWYGGRVPVGLRRSTSHRVLVPTYLTKTTPPLWEWAPRTGPTSTP